MHNNIWITIIPKILEINNKNLEGSLIVQDFPNLEKINCRDVN